MPTAIVTGAAIRIGKAIALHLAAKGFNIALHYHRSEPSTVIKEIKSKGVYCQSYSSDLSNLDEAEQFIAKICLLYTSPSPRDATLSRMPSSA